MLVTVLDADGSPVAQSQTSMVFPDPATGRTWHAHQFPAFPRRGQRVRFRFYQFGARGTWEPLGEVAVPNPDPGPHPRWTAQPLPLTRAADGVDFTLESLQTGLGPMGTDRPAAPGEQPGTRVVVRASREGKPAPWEPVDLTISDATGNRWTGGASSRQDRGPGRNALQMSAALPSGEPAYRVGVRLARTAGFGPEELWTVRGLPVPARGKTVKLEREERVGEVLLQVRGLTGPGGTMAGSDISYTSSQAALHLHVVLPTGLPEARRPRIDLVRVVDDRGRAVRVAGYSSSEKDYAFDLAVEPGMRTLDATFAVHRPVQVEFLAAATSAAAAPRGR